MKRIKTIKAAEIEKELRAAFGDAMMSTGEYCYPLKLPTLLGVLRISPCDGAIRTRFDEVPISSPVGAPLNPYSGKWNFEGLDDAMALGRAMHWIRRVAGIAKEIV